MNASRILILLAIVACGCSSKTTTTNTRSSTSSPSGKYSEDLSGLRPKSQSPDTVKQQTGQQTSGAKAQTRYVEAKYDVNDELNAVLDSISEQNLAMGLVDGFTIQVYSGLKREEALNVKKQMAIAVPELDSEIQYAQPNFRVRAGKYFDRYDAQKDYQLIKKHFPNAIILPERVPIR